MGSSVPSKPPHRITLPAPIYAPQPMEQLLQQVRGAAHTVVEAAARGLKAAEGAARGLWAKLTAGQQQQQQEL